MKTTKTLVGLIASLPFLTPDPALAVDKVWANNANHQWPIAANWIPNGAPGTFDTAIFNVAPQNSVLFINNQFQAIDAVVDRLRIDSNPVTFTGSPSTLTIDSTNITETGRALVIGRLGSGTPNGVLNNWLSELNTVYATLGSDAGSSGTLNVNNGIFNVTGTGAVQDLIIGSSGGGTISVNGGADVSVAGTTMLGLNAGSTGTITLNNAGSLWTNTGNLHIGGSGAATLTINAGQVNSPTGYVGYSARSNATATISGSSSSWLNSIGAIVGYSGTGEMNVSAGAQVTGGTSGYAGYFEDGIGTVTVTGSGSDWTNTLSTIIGSQGEGSLTISAGGLVSDQFGIVGQAAGSFGQAIVTGANSKWQNSGNFWVGDGGEGVLEISSGGMVTCADVFIADDADAVAHVTVNGGTLTSNGHALLANQAGASATVNMTGGTWHSDEAIVVGVAGDAMVNGAGCEITCQGLVIAEQVGSTGAVTINGIGSTWTGTATYIGNSGQGTLSVGGGAVVEIGSVHLGSTAGALGEVTIDGNQSWVIASDLRVGDSGEGVIHILNGGTLGNTAAYIGYSSGSFGHVTVEGVGSTWYAADDVRVGVFGAGRLDILEGGRVNHNSPEPHGGIFRVGWSGSDSTGEVNVTGENSRLEVEKDLIVYDVLNIADAGQVIITVGCGRIGDLSSGAIVTVDGAGSMWKVGDPLPQPLLFSGANGTLTVTNAAQVISSFSFVGGGDQVLIDGPESQWTASTIQVDSSGSVIVKNGGVLDAVEIIVGYLAELGGDGEITGDLQSGGLVAPGTSAGSLHIGGNYAQTTDGELVIELASLSSYDHLPVTGTATLDGTLTVSPIDGFAPAPGDSFTIITADDIDGEFATLNLPKGMEISYTPISVMLEVASAPCPADISSDGQVNVIDLLYVINLWGPCANPNNCAADINGDDQVNVIDLLAVINAWGACP